MDLTNYQSLNNFSKRLSRGSKIMVAMSGGVDSSTVAAILKDYGYNVVGATLLLYPDNETSKSSNGKSCCATADIIDAKKVAQQIGISHYTIDCVSLFQEKVINYFVNSYINGLTPIPCSKCNELVKFGYLLDFAKNSGCDALVTGHYVEKKFKNGINELHTGIDNKKDQSYFVFSLTQDQLNFVEFPLGGLSKNETRSLAASYGLSVSKKKESQDICFVTNGYVNFISRESGDKICKRGEIVNTSGDFLGFHNGIINYTIGQRKGIGLSIGTDPLYVIHIDALNNRIIVGHKDELKGSLFYIENINWINNDAEMHLGKTIDVCIRANSNRIEAVVSLDECGQVLCKVMVPCFAIAPGQACVMYSGSRVLGGGWIKLLEKS
ncbi:tRNA-specific 2-thiouridylase MnmA [Candidatus Xenohaliotis californiensis]|uniref:tRNA-specific 2-thiouridylase MnmA n=1 Tax=Candidatus Xenohaliotis californiensis TaxID=84677 RepID=A0ABM9N813_9RICK|nr:tRNA-specific 2-thiouridylase MnmA [Candidatus Xenohaliotis californiensis]